MRINIDKIYLVIVTCHCFFHRAKKLRSGAIVRFSDNSSFSLYKCAHMENGNIHDFSRLLVSRVGNGFCRNGVDFSFSINEHKMTRVNNGINSI